MTAYTHYFNRFLGGGFLRWSSSPKTRVEPMASKQTGLQHGGTEMRAFDNDLQIVLPAEKNDFLAEEIKIPIADTTITKPLYSPFWFWNSNLADELALEFIREGDAEKALSIWEKALLPKDKKKLVQAVLIGDLISQSPDWLEEKDEFHSLTKNGDEYISSREKKTGSSIPCVFADLGYGDNWTIEVDTKWFEGVDKYS